MKNSRRVIPTYPMFAKGLFLIFILGLTVWGHWIITGNNLISMIFNHSQTWCKDFELNDNLSCGEESLFTQDNFKSFQPFQQGEFKKAVVSFSQERNKDKNNPEILIYLNNAKLMEQKRKSYTIAVVVPINQDGQDTAEALLRGAAQVQEEFNKNPQNTGLKILIVNDKNNSQTVVNLAKYLLSKNDVVAVIGHYTSELTKETLPTYQKKEIVVISPSATALRKTILDNEKYPKNFFFRTVSNVSVTTTILIDQLKLSELKSGDKVAVFYTKNSTYSESLFEQVTKKIGENKIIAEDVSKSNFIPNQILNKVKQQGAKALILIPDGRINTNAFDNMLSIIDANQDELPMAGTWVMYNPQILNRRNIVKKLLIVTPWHRLSSPNQEFITRATQIWGTDNIDAVTAMSYDAALVLTKALEQVSINDSLKNQRLYIQQQLSSSLKVTGGASGTISFDNDGDRKESISQIVRVVRTQCSEYGAMFVPINYNLPVSGCP